MVDKIKKLVLSEFYMKVKVILERQEEEKDVTPYVKTILTLLATGSVLSACLVMPGLARLLPKDKKYSKYDDPQWRKFNLPLLRRELRRLQKQKDLVIYYKKKIPYFKMTEKGTVRAMKYRLLMLSESSRVKWDGKWRLIIYDIPEDRKRERDAMRRILKNMRLYQLQESVYLTPLSCENEIGYIRNFLNIGDFVKALTISGLEDEQVYRDFFGV